MNEDSMVVLDQHTRLECCDRKRTASIAYLAVNAEETILIELQLELQPYYDNRESSNMRGVKRGISDARRGWSSNSSQGDQREVSFGGPTLPRGSATLEEDTFEFGTVSLREIEF
jgi:hypothetical protein